MESSSSRPIDYDTHILIGSKSSGKMIVICHWSHLPRQAEVQQRMESVQEWYATFLLCTPTSIMPVENNGERKQEFFTGAPPTNAMRGPAHLVFEVECGPAQPVAANRASLPSRRVKRGS